MVLPLYDHNPFTLPVRPVVTWGIIAVNFAVFFVQLGLGDADNNALIDALGAVPSHIVGPQSRPPLAYLTLFTCLWLHEGWQHILGNMIFLFVFGDDIEEVLGRWHFLAFYMLCGLGSSAAFVVTNAHSSLPLIGASGAIAGVMAAYLLIRPCARVVVALFTTFLVLPVPAGLAIGLWGLLQVYQVATGTSSADGENVAYIAHVGGLIAGIVLFLFMRPKKVKLFQCMWDPEKASGPPPQGKAGATNLCTVYGATIGTSPMRRSSGTLRRLSGLVAATCLGVLAATDFAAAQLPIAVEARATLLARAYNASAQRLFQEFAATPGNIVFSPYSIGTAMAMALTGARGDTASEMARVLTQRMAPEAIDTANAEMLAILRGYDHSADPPICPPGTTPNARSCEGPPTGTAAGAGTQCSFGMRLEGGRCIGAGTVRPSAKLLAANALMLVRRGDLVSDDYAMTLRTRYGADVFKDASLDDINGWVSRATEGTIGKLLSALDPRAAAVLLNAVYFKAAWDAPFSKALTKDDSFSLTQSQKVSVPFMNERGNFSMVSRGGYRAIRLPYAVRGIGMIVVLPDGVEGAGDVARRLGPAELADLFAALRNGQSMRPVALALPRFKAEYAADLVAPFEAAGMHKAFDPQAADFSGMAGRPLAPGALHIGQIMHRALIDVTEETTEAAAATAIVVRPASAPAPQTFEPFRVDRAFLFYIVEDASGAILFQGRIADPR